jgi:opacity protein-like surface antigen
MLRRLLLGTAVAIVAASPAAAKDGQVYVGVSAGILFPKDPSGHTVFVDYSATQTPALPLATIPADATFNNAGDNLNAKSGYDLDLLAGYDFGMFRIEGELSYKHTKIKSDIDSDLVDAINLALNTPVVNPLAVAAIDGSEFDLSKNAHVWSGMVNALLDLGGETGLGGYLGAGAGYASVHALGESRGGFAWQLIAGVYYPISSNIDIGLKGRYFRTANVSNEDNFTLTGNPRTVLVGTTPVVQTVTADVFSDSSYRFKSFSLLATLAYNFGSAAPPPEPAPLPPPPPPPPPSTQTCADGSVILATDVCPAPPPPPPPAPAPERG